MAHPLHVKIGEGVRTSAEMAGSGPREDIMLTKIYIALWLVIAAAALGVYVTGNMSVMAVVAFGFVCFGMVFMGMMSVLPTAVHDSLVRH